MGLVAGMLVISWLVVNKTDAIQCASNANRWAIKDCNYSYLLFTMHNVVTILLAAICRYTLVKTTTDRHKRSFVKKVSLVASEFGTSFRNNGDADG